MTLDNKTQEDHQVGILIVIATDPYMNTILVIDGPVRTGENAYIKITCIHQGKILGNLFQVLIFLPVEFKNDHVVFHT